MTEGEKLLALSECSRIPDVDAIFRDNAVWSFFGLWYGDYLVGQDGTLNGKYISTDDLIKYYNSDGTLSLSEYIKMSQKSLAN
ncbi:beta-mannanase [Ruminococcus sp. CAG:379]|nr:beta-mannanase [Ruminococcus sp. CAG:379]